ncbi:hypothetical protein COEREDRAFT_9786 [Coemansia reversa NRRL 1564]|uniref:LITAF domain-containing protein n=1 Tax=Coemansia reversa (strain ATCC 12441 / NRRL 1564) TaxID=763665 RepID=A0A2G5B7G2_COERN|nr:hypothetical protein COEREDRAFT_9786 [Coemansia reversa NRRL 1564]|eukprot:PIA14922.1 hypothetical protein COEREDRAFT_9786 [Coemansia reversa NRRL 1564]
MSTAIHMVPVIRSPPRHTISLDTQCTHILMVGTTATCMVIATWVVESMVVVVAVVAMAESMVVAMAEEVDLVEEEVDLAVEEVDLGGGFGGGGGGFGGGGGGFGGGENGYGGEGYGGGGYGGGGYGGNYGSGGGYGGGYGGGEGYGGGFGSGGYGQNSGYPYSRFSRSSIFVPTDWNFDGTSTGLAGFVGRVVRHLDRQYTSESGMISGAHQHQYGRHSSGYGMHPGASMVSIAQDPHGMFSQGGMSRMNLGHGRASISSKSVPTVCPRCSAEIMTLVKRRPNALNVIASTGAVVAGLVLKLPVALLPLAMLPLQVRALHPKVHYCPRCMYKLGKNVKLAIPLDEE